MAKLIDNILKAEATLGVTVTEGGSYDDTELRERVEALEQREDKDTVYDDTEIKAEIAEKQDKLTFDDAPTLNSSNPVTSGGVYSAIESQRGDYVTAGQKEGTTLGECATAEGSATTASGNAAHSEGTMAVASGENSHSEGNFTVAASDNQHVFGNYNVEDTGNKYVEIVGNGNSSVRSNARTLDWKGNEWIAGKYSQNGTPTERSDLATKAYVDDNAYDDTALSAEVYANTEALGGHTLGMSVPAGSKLTDTVYDDTEVRKLITAKQDILTFDTTPTENSTNPVTSGGVKAYVDANAGGGSSSETSGLDTLIDLVLDAETSHIDITFDKPKKYKQFVVRLKVIGSANNSAQGNVYIKLNQIDQWYTGITYSNASQIKSTDIRYCYSQCEMVIPSGVICSTINSPSEFTMYSNTTWRGLYDAYKYGDTLNKISIATQNWRNQLGVGSTFEVYGIW